MVGLGRKDQAREGFFFEKKKQKTFANLVAALKRRPQQAAAKESKVFWFFFSKKNSLTALLFLAVPLFVTGADVVKAGMRLADRRNSGRVAQLVRLLTVLLALAGQVAWGTPAGATDAAESPAAALRAAMIFCQAGQAADHRGVPPRHHHVADPAILQASVTAHQSALLSEASWVPVPNEGPRVRTSRAQARAPPVWRAVAAYPTGPPTLA